MGTYNIGQANAVNMAVGDGNSVSVDTPSTRAGLDQLTTAVRNNRSALADPDALEQSLELLREQLETDPSDSTRVRPLLSLIVSQAGDVPSVLAAATTLRSLADG
jgi:hypothetical protein